jgi:hypothetical protein
MIRSIRCKIAKARGAQRAIVMAFARDLVEVPALGFGKEADLVRNEWWQLLGRQYGSESLLSVRAVVPGEGAVYQSNSSVLPFRLLMEDGECLPVAVKTVDLSKNKYACAIPRLDHEQQAVALHDLFKFNLAP